jgi:hypothetical protein
MKLYLTLENNAGVLDSIAVDTHHDNDSAEVSEWVWSALEGSGWMLAPGDTIKITERE